MPARTLPGAGLRAYYDPGETGWDATVNPDFRLISALLGGSVVSSTTVLPGSGSAGDVYIVRSDDGSNPNKIAVWDGASGAEAWVYLTPLEGWQFRDRLNEYVVQFDGAAWVVANAVSFLTDVDVETVAPTDGQVLAWDDVNSLWVPATIVGGGGGGGASELDDLTDVDLTTSPPNTGQALVYNGTLFAPADVAGSGFGAPFLGAQVKPNGQVVGLDFDPAAAFAGWGVEDYDAGDWWDNASPSRMTVPTGVDIVAVAASVGASAQTNGEWFRVYFIKNGDTSRTYGNNRVQVDTDSNAFCVAFATIPVAAGDYIECFARTEADDSINVFDSSIFSIRAVSGLAISSPTTGNPSGAISGNPWYSVSLDEAATPADNAAALQSVMDQGVKMIQLNAGVFDVDPVDMRSQVHLRGRGVGQTTLRLGPRTISDVASFGGVLNVYGVSGTPLENVKIADLTIDGNKANITVSGTTEPNNIEGIDYKFAKHCDAVRVRVINTVGDGLDYDDSDNCVNYSCEFDGTGGNGVHFSLASIGCVSVAPTMNNCGHDRSRGGFDTASTSRDCKFVAPRTVGCYRGGDLYGDRTQVIGHNDNDSVNNGLRINGAHCRVDGTWEGTTGGAAVTVAAGASHNSVTGNAINGTADGFVVEATSSHNTICVISKSNAGTGLLLAGDENSAVGCVLDQNGVNFSDTGTGNVTSGQIVS